MNWWRTMNLRPWCGSIRVLASSTEDYPFAQAIAAERFKIRGKRQRITVNPPNPGGSGLPLLYVQDAPEAVAEPCS